jgi:hypothetical protein
MPGKTMPGKDFMAFVRDVARPGPHVLRDGVADKIDLLLDEVRSGTKTEDQAAEALEDHFRDIGYQVDDTECKVILRMVNGSGQSAKKITPLY